MGVTDRCRRRILPHRRPNGGTPSLDGVLRAAESFAQLGDVEEVELSLHVARDLAGSDSEAVDDVQAAAGRLSDLLEAARTDEGGD
jgi:hypothetical protein